MKASLKNFLKIVLPIGIGIFFIWYFLHSSTHEERKEIWNHIINANPFWIIISTLIGVLSHISRAYRWRFLVETLGYKPRMSVSYMSVMIGYFANLGIPRSGEVLRAATLTNYEGIPFQKTIGTIITERIIDLIMLLLIIALGFIINTELFLSYFNEKNINPLFIVAGIILFCGILYLGYFLLKKTELKALDKIKKFVFEVYDGVLSIFKIKKIFPFIFHTFFIWMAYVLMFYTMKYAISEISNLSFSAAIATFIVGSFAMTASNGGFGIFHVAVGAFLIFYNIEKPIGEAYGLVLWGSQTLMNIIIGGLSFILLPFFSKRK